MRWSISSSGVHRATEALLAVCTFLLIILVYLRLESAPLLYDEVFHFRRIMLLLNGTMTLRDFGVMFPGYHLLTAGLLRLSGQTSIPAVRFVSLLFSLTSCIAAYGVARAVDRPSALLRTLQFAALPILLPFFPLIYTDTLSLSLVLFALLAALHGRLLFLSLLFLLATLVRQNTILWAPLLLAILLEAEPVWRISATEPVAWLREAAKRIQDGHALRILLRLGMPLLLPIIVFLLFVAVTGRASFNPDLAAAHPFPSFTFGNIFFTLFLFTVLFFPLICARARAIFLLLRQTWILPPLVILYVLFSFGFHVDHPANSEAGRFRDVILLAAAAGGTTGFLFWLTGAVAVLTMIVTPLARKSFIWIYPLSLLSLGGSWLIETRYAVVPLVLFLLLRKPNSWRTEILQLVFNLILLLWVFW
ncbi:MAG: hypothetical protein V1876_03465 [Candidatus Peregrinibacteria bacterium]